MTDSTTAASPLRIGRYHLLEKVGSGGMGTVYRAHDPYLDRLVALKVPHGGIRDERFQREARAAVRILHPNVCPIFDVGEHDGTPFVVMAFIEGHSLSHYLSQGAAHAVPDAIGLIVQVLEGLTAVHAGGIVHRDIKPGNILINALVPQVSNSLS